MKTISSVLFLASLFALSGGCYAEVNDTPAAYKISSIKAFLLFNQKGTISEDIIDNPNYAKGGLRNTITGEGSAGSPSREVQVVVDIAGKPESYNSKIKIVFSASENGIAKEQRTVKVGGLNQTGHYFAAFLVYDTGCKPLTLSATLVGQSNESKMEKTIEFECGE